MVVQTLIQKGLKLVSNKNGQERTHLRAIKAKIAGITGLFNVRKERWGSLVLIPLTWGDGGAINQIGKQRRRRGRWGDKSL